MRVPQGPAAPGSADMLVPYAPPKKVSVTKPLDFLVIVLLPWLIFSLVVALFAFSYQDFAPLVWALVAASGLLGFLFISMGATRRKSAQIVLGFLIVASVGLALPIGLHLVSHYMADFFAVDGGATYHGVSPTAPGASYLDASAVEFTHGAYTDTQHSVGYMKFGTVYCVAPIFSAGGTRTPPSFWAVGKDCCEQKGKFTCGDVTNTAAHSGVRVEGDREDFVNAARMAAATYRNLTSAKTEDMVFLRWTADAVAYKEKLWSSAATFATTASAVHLLGSAGAGMMLGRCTLR